MKKHTRELDRKAQAERFRETARELGCEEDEATFREKLRVVARQRPKAERLGIQKKVTRDS